MKISRWFILLILLLIGYSYNGLTQMKACRLFSFQTPTQTPGDSIYFNLYYSVDSSSFFKHKGINFYKLTFSQNLSHHTGYISYDPINKNILFIDDTTIKKGRNVMQKVFCFMNTKSYAINNFGFLKGSFLLKRITSPNKIVVFKPMYRFPMDSHSIYIESVEFNNELLPSRINFKVPFGDEKVIQVSFLDCPSCR